MALYQSYFNMNHLFTHKVCSIWRIDWTLSDAYTPGQSGPGSNGNEKVLHIPHIAKLLLPCPGNLMFYSPTSGALSIKSHGLFPSREQCPGSIMCYFPLCAMSRVSHVLFPTMLPCRGHLMCYILLCCHVQSITCAISPSDVTSRASRVLFLALLPCPGHLVLFPFFVTWSIQIVIFPFFVFNFCFSICPSATSILLLLADVISCFMWLVFVVFFIFLELLNCCSCAVHNADESSSSFSRHISYLRYSSRSKVHTSSRIIIIYSFRAFHISVSWWSFTGVIASLLKSSGFFSVFWLFLILQSYTPSVLICCIPL